MNLPQKSEVRHISSEIRKTEQQLKKVTDSVKDDDKRIRRAISNLIDRRVMEILDRTDVEELNRSGERIRVNALKKEGYQLINFR